MNRNFDYNFKQTKNNNDKYYEIYRYFESISNREHSAFQELLDYTLKNKTNLKKKNKKA
ncbi:MAG: hypothetical protein WCY24_08850 [Lutispora sp.]|nr:hypothetical protein [Lutispora sp.]MDD4834480.1 hypothetical protein [Lutispora sp.]